MCQLPRHAVELLAEGGELVATDGGDRRREVAAAQPPGRLQEARQLALQRPGGQEREEEGQDQEGRD